MSNLPPEHPDSPASPFAPFQPGMGVVADDVPDDRVGSGRKAAEVSAELGPKLAKERRQQEEASAKAAEEARDGMEEHLRSREDATADSMVVEDGVAKAAPAKGASKSAGDKK